jgi:N-acetylglucosaminyldiphosphoundecaprenol N-acetyl-beta-D-mannosaminyltransferase
MPGGSVGRVNDAASTAPARRRLFGLDFVDEPDLARVAADVVAHGPGVSGSLPVLVTPNVDFVVRRDAIPEPARRVLEEARWCLPDGQPIVWASRVLGRPLTARLPGSTLVELLWNDPAYASVPAAVVASTPAIASAVTSSRPGTHVVVAPVISAHDARDAERFVEREVDAILAARPSLVFVAVGFPKDQLLIAALLARWPAAVERPVFLAVGASFEMLFGMRRRAPRWMQRFGLEWFFRFVQEPRRLFVRYFVRDPAFLRCVLREWRRGRP